MTSVLLPFLMYMLLGRTIDLKSYQIGGDIFDYRNYDETNIRTINTTYAVLQDNTFPFSFTGFPVDLVLRIKSGYNSPSLREGITRLLTETAWKQRSVVVIVGTAVQSVKRALKENAQPLPNWTTRISQSQTHYANSVVYGGLAFFLYQFKCDIPGDVETVRRTLTDILGLNGDFGPDTARKWHKILSSISKNEEIRGEVKVDVHTYATFPFRHHVTSFGELLRELGEVPKLFAGTIGRPIAMELLPLHTLNQSYPNVTENHDLDRQLEEVDNMYDDLKNTKNSINHWLDQTSAIFSEEDETKVADLAGHLSACLKVFNQIASEASVYKQMDAKLVETAMDLYTRNLTRYSYSYDRIFRKIKEKIDAECEDTFLHKIKGLLQVDDSERIVLGQVEGGLEECKTACLAVPECRSIGFADRLVELKKLSPFSSPSYKLIIKKNQCFVYFRSSSTADVIAAAGASVTGVYDRKCL